MADLILGTCCSGFLPEIKQDGGGAYFACPKCKRRSLSIPVTGHIGRHIVVEPDAAKKAIETWNDSIRKKEVVVDG